MRLPYELKLEVTTELVNANASIMAAMKAITLEEIAKEEEGMDVDYRDLFKKLDRVHSRLVNIVASEI